MKRNCFCLTLLFLILSALAGCNLATPDWEGEYEAVLGRPIAELNVEALRSEFMDTQGNLTRVSWARLENNELVLLGVPAAGNPPEQVVARTVILTEPEWKQFCADALGRDLDEIYGWGWGVAEGTVGNRFDVYPGLEPLDPGESVALPDPDSPYCEFQYLPSGWELHIVENEGIVKSER